MTLEVGTTRELLLLASFVTCPPLIGEYLKLRLQATFATWHSSNGEDSLYSWLATCQFIFLWLCLSVKVVRFPIYF